jgi:hypothetical protein
MATLTIAAYDGTTDSGNIQNPVRGTAGLDLIAAGVQLDSDDRVVVDVEFNDDVVLFLFDTGGGAVVTVEAGENPPSHRAGLGDDTVTVPGDDLLPYVPEAGRHIKADGTIVLTSTQQVLVWAYRMRPAFIGVGTTNEVSIPVAPTD